jgi:hypothetical protein
MAKCSGCSSTTCNCSLVAGTGITVTGDGSSGTPWNVSITPVTDSYLEIYHAGSFTNSGFPPWDAPDLVKKTGTAIDFINDPDWGGWVVKVFEDGVYTMESNWRITQDNNGHGAVVIFTVHTGPAPDFIDADTRRKNQTSIETTAGTTWYAGHTTFYTAAAGDYFYIQIGISSGTLTYDQTRFAIAKV